MIDESLAVLRWMSQAAVFTITGSSFSWLFCAKNLREKVAGFNSAYIKLCVLSSLALILSQALVVVVHYLSVKIALGDDDLSLLLGIKSFIENTRAGKIGAARVAVALIVLTVSIRLLKNQSSSVMRYCVAMIFGGGAIIVFLGAFSGHFSGRPDALKWMFIQELHLLAIALWAGGLPLWLFLVKSKLRKNNIDFETVEFAKKFSLIAMITVAVITSTGILMSSEFILNEGDLVGTPWGRWLMLKITLVAIALFLGNNVRRNLWKWQIKSSTTSVVKATNCVALEMMVIVFVLFAASFMGSTTPALHDRAFWPLPFRISFEQAWNDSVMRLTILGGCVGIAVTFFLLFVTRKRVTDIKRIELMLLSFFSVVSVLWAAAIPAHPDTFRRSEAPYLAESISSGMNIFRENCVVCHGRGGHGDGERASKMSVPPADLTAPHTALHTAGDMFWWVRNGIPESGMPGFGNGLTEIESWDVVNFLRAFSQGFQARLITSRIVFEKPWLGAPEFYFYDKDANVKQLKSLRDSCFVMIVMASSYLEIKQRIKVIAEWNENKNAKKLILILVVKDDDAPRNSDQFMTALSARDVYDSYSLLARTLSFRGDSNAISVFRKHAEYLIDEHGYIRARWVEGDEFPGWHEIKSLEMEISKLRAEKFIPKPPDAHIH